MKIGKLHINGRTTTAQIKRDLKGAQADLAKMQKRRRQEGPSKELDALIANAKKYIRYLEQEL